MGKEKNAARMKEHYYTDQGQAVEHTKRRTPRSRYMKGKYSANRRGKEFDLPYEYYIEIIKHPCYYCGTSIADETGIGLDRMDNDKGYVMGNVNPSCTKCNRIRSKSMGAEEFARQTKINRGEDNGET